MWKREREDCPDFIKELGERNGLSHCLRQCYILSLCGGQCYFCLKFGGPDQGAIGIFDNVPGSGHYRGRFVAVLRVPSRSKTSINVYFDTICVVGLINEALTMRVVGRDVEEVFQNIFDRALMGAAGVVAKPGTLMDSISQLGVSGIG